MTAASSAETNKNNDVSWLASERSIDVVNRLLGHSDAEAYISEVPGQELYFLLRDVGFSDASDVLRYCSAEQIQVILDLDGWRKDLLDVPQTFSWIQAILDAGPVKTGQVFAEVDHEWVVSFFVEFLRVYETSEEDGVPEEPRGYFYQTPDGVYMVDILSSEYGGLIERWIDALYRYNPALARRILMGIRWDAGPETQEHAYRFHTARMADLGYMEFHEALGMYQFLAPDSIQPGDKSVLDTADPAFAAPLHAFLPAEWSQQIRLQDLLLGQALGHMPSTERNVALRYVLLLLNRAISAEQIDLADSEATLSILQRTLGYLSLGVEYVGKTKAMNVASGALETSTSSGKQRAQKRLAGAVHALQTVPMISLFHVGYSLTVQLAKLAHLLVEEGLVTLHPKDDPATLVEQPYADTLRGLLPKSIRPMYNKQLDDVTTSGYRPFSTLLDVQKATHHLQEIGTINQFLTLGLGLRKEILAETIRKSQRPTVDVERMDVVGTMIANGLLQRPAVLVLLDPKDLLVLQELMLVPGTAKVRPAVHKQILGLVHARIKERSLDEKEEALLWSSAAQAFIEKTIQNLADSLAIVPKDIEHKPQLWYSVTGCLIAR